jgi:DNA-binding PadR family transcriptional regulator
MVEPVNLGEFEQVVLLAILRRQGDGAYGISIRAEIAACTKRDPAPGAIYTTLMRLERKGLVTSSEGEPTPQRRGRPKRYYRVTAEGVRLLKRARQDFLSLSNGLTLRGVIDA